MPFLDNTFRRGFFLCLFVKRLRELLCCSLGKCGRRVGVCVGRPDGHKSGCPDGGGGGGALGGGIV